MKTTYQLLIGCLLTALSFSSAVGQCYIPSARIQPAERYLATGASASITLEGAIQPQVAYTLYKDDVSTGETRYGNHLGFLYWVVNTPGNYSVKADQEGCTQPMDGICRVYERPSVTQFSANCALQAFSDKATIDCSSSTDVANFTLLCHSAGNRYYLRESGGTVSGTDRYGDGSSTPIVWQVSNAGSYEVWGALEGNIGELPIVCDSNGPGDPGDPPPPSCSWVSILLPPDNPTTSLCAGESIKLRARGGHPTNPQYVWYEGSTSNLVGNGVELPVSLPGTYILTARNTCGDTRQASITITGIPDVSNARFTSGTDLVTRCQGSGTSSFSAVANNAENVEWSILPAGSGNTVSVNGIVEWSAGFSGEATIRYRAYGCSGNSVRADHRVYVFSIPQAGNNRTTYQDGDLIDLSDASPAGGTWSGSAAIQGHFFDPRQVGPGTYVLTYTVGDQGCNSDTRTIRVNSIDNNHNYVREATLRIATRGGGSPLRENDIPYLDAREKNEVTSYLDGIGRPVQQVIWQGDPEPSRSDQISATAYDKRGRAAQAYLPYVSGNNGYFKDNAENATVGYYQRSNNSSLGIVSDSKPFAATEFEASPLSRPKQQGAPGAAFQPDQGHAVTYAYASNEANQVKFWRINGNDLPYQDGTYPANRLYMTQSTDEDGRVVREFTDKLDRTVLKRVVVDESNEDYQDTYYVYDNLNRLRYVLSPEGSEAYVGSATATNTELLNRWAFQYRYDERGNMIEKRVPGADWQYMIYDKRDRLVLSQDGRQREQEEWLFTHYDALNRPLVTGIYRSDVDYQDMRTALDTHLVTDPENNANPVNEEQVSSYQHGDPGLALSAYKQERRITATQFITLLPGFEVDYQSAGTVDIGLSATGPTPAASGAFPPLADSEVLQLYHYDSYDFDQDGSADYAYDESGIPSEADITSYDQVRGQPTGTTTRVLSTGQWLTNALFYDDQGRVIQTQADNYVGGRDKITTEYSFHGLVQRQWHQQTSDAARGSEDLTVLTRHTYDHADRLTHVYQTVGEAPEQQLARYEYNELGQLIDKGLHRVSSDRYCQSVNYRYSIRGWLSLLTRLI